MTPAQKRAGLSYLFIQFFLIPALLAYGNRLLPVPMPEAVLSSIFHIFNFLCVVILFHRYLLQSSRVFFRDFLGGFLTAAVCLMLYFAAEYLFGLVVSRIYPGFYNVNDQAVSAAYDGWLQILILVLLVPLTEETLYRGLLFQFSRSKGAALLVSTAIFAFIHVAGYLGSYPPIQLFVCFLQYIPAGLCLGYAFIRSGSILTPMLMHMVINGVGILQMR